MDKLVINTSPLPAHAEEQLDWVRLLERSHGNPKAKTAAPLILGATRVGKTRLAEDLIAGGSRHE